MPRRKSQEEPILNADHLLMLPPPRVSHKREHREDPFESPPGAVPHVVASEPLKRKLTKAELSERDTARKEHKFLKARHMRYMDLLWKHRSKEESAQELALAEVFDLSLDEVRVGMVDLLSEVRRGLGVTPLGELLEENGLDLTGRVKILSKHAYSDNPAASLKAVDMANDLNGVGGDAGSFESYLRLSKTQKG